MKQIPLPPLGNGQFQRITIHGQQNRPEAPPQAPPPEHPEILFERDPSNFIVVEENARITHPLVRDASAGLRGARPDSDGTIHTPRGCLDVRVSKASITRALRVLRALLRALEARGYTATINDGKTFLTVLGESHRVF